MAFLFGGRARTKSPADLARAVKEALPKLSDTVTKSKAEEDVAKHMSQMKLIVQGTPGMMVTGQMC